MGYVYLRASPSTPAKIIVLSLVTTVFPAQPESLSRLLCVRVSAKRCTEVGLFPHAWVYKNSINMRSGNICLYMDGSATAETTSNYTGLEDLEEGYQILKIHGDVRDSATQNAISRGNLRKPSTCADLS